MLNQEQLARLRFPLGEHTKTYVREQARARGLPVAERAESQDLCFIPGGDYRRFLSARAPQVTQPGPIRDSAGKRLGQHQGLAFYTIGQRKGLDITGSQRLYVLALEPAENALIVGPAQALGRARCRVRDMHWVAGEPPDERFAARAQIRYQAPAVPVTVSIKKETQGQALQIQFQQPQRDITPGQALVLYHQEQAERLLGGGTIMREDLCP